MTRLHRYGLILPGLVALAACRASGAEIAEAELTPAQQQRMATRVEAMVQGSVMRQPQTFTIRVTDTAGRPIAGVPAVAVVARADADPVASLRQRKGIFNSNEQALLSDGQGWITLQADKYVYAQLYLDLRSIGSRWIVPWRLDDPRYPISDAVEDMGWIAQGKSGDLRRTATVTLSPSTKPETLLKINWRPGVRQLDGLRSVMVTLGDHGKSHGTRVSGHRAFDPAAAPRDLVLRGWRAEGKRRARPWLGRSEGVRGTETFRFHQAPKEERSAEATPWWIEVTGMRGVGFVDASTDAWAYHAPEDGWRLRLRFGSEDGSRTEIPVRFWIRRPGVPVRYALFDGVVRLVRPEIPNPEFAPDPQPGHPQYPEQDEIGLFGTLWINPTGSRNLERPGTNSQEDYWLPKPDACQNLNRHEPMLSAWAAEPPEGLVPLIDDLPPAIEGAPASVPHGAPLAPVKP